MHVKLKSGIMIELGTAVVRNGHEGTVISHREFNATINGQPTTVTIEDLEGAQFPAGVTSAAQATFDASLPDVRASWQTLARKVGLK